MGMRYVPSDLEGEANKDLEDLRNKLLSHPSPGASGPTGSWRLFRPEVSAAKCVKCGICWLYCPEDVIAWTQRELPRIDYTYCKGCGVCASVCPTKAIEMVVEGE
ncbi:MAG: 4Fe-4S binding protein [Acidilobaceae archaeon]|nr:4Fe-4S binding protein [Acidilobaceae archaeon]